MAKQPRCKPARPVLTKGRVVRAREAVKRGHTHSPGFQMIYALESKARFWHDGFGTVDVVAGRMVYQPGIRHEMLSCARNCEILETTMPAEFAAQSA